ncbi:unnamed protein product [Phytophthora lilii]|uniref:Unnamed protein product n=1 Tax=Phytophthora lilii TaxID=2077276 RepID=A0A9W7CQX7_9STRA|nr:unnamed protein product [Phytophthora lilii]
MLDPIAPDYGHSLKTATPVDVTGYTEMWWQNDEYKEGFIASHEGPCEAWIDDVQIFHHDNCAAEFQIVPGQGTGGLLVVQACSCSTGWRCTSLTGRSTGSVCRSRTMVRACYHDAVFCSDATAQTLGSDATTQTPSADDAASGVEQTDGSVGGEASGAEQTVPSSTTAAPTAVTPAPKEVEASWMSVSTVG